MSGLFVVRATSTDRNRRERVTLDSPPMPEDAARALAPYWPEEIGYVAKVWQVAVVAEGTPCGATPLKGRHL